MTNLRPFALEQAYIIFAVIYFPVSYLFLNRGDLAFALLTVYTLVMFTLGLVLIGKFAIYLARSANAHDGRFGSVFISYLLDALVPLVMFKMYFNVTWDLLTSFHSGCWCQLIDFVRQIFFLYDLFGRQAVLNNLIFGSLAVMGLAAVWSIGMTPKKK